MPGASALYIYVCKPICVLGTYAGFTFGPCFYFCTIIGL